MTGRNRLTAATSPYLRQHADNPVHWCHWCHVMAHESFEDDVTAKLINDNFVAIKVDREERPDVDTVYMQATQAMTGHGGWPMSVFLTPDRRPFYAGTYFPSTPRHGMPSFTQVVSAIADAWRDRRADVDDSAVKIVEQLAKIGVDGGGPADIDLAAVMAELKRSFDPVYGGFGGAPK